MKMIDKNETLYLTNDEKDILKFIQTKEGIHVEIINILEGISENQFKDLIKNSPLKSFDLFCKIFENEEDNIRFLTQLGFSFYGVEHIPEKDSLIEIYHFRYKDEFFIGENELDDILKKLNL